MINELDFEKELEKIKSLCDQYGYRCFVQVDQIHIVTQCEAWFFIPREDGVIKLMHGNSIGQIQNGYHKQFIRKMSYKNLFIYISEHQRGKYSDKKVEKFTFTKTGGSLNIGRLAV